MNKVNIMICDDNKIQIELLEKYIRLFFENRKTVLILSKFYSGKKLIESDFAKDCDIVFLDVEMPEMDGIETAEILKEKNKNTIIIFLTAHEEYALKAFGVKAYDYMIKPVEKEKIFKLLIETTEKITENKKNESSVILNTQESIVKIKIGQFIYLEKENRKIKIVTENGIYYTGNSVKSYEKEFSGFSEIVKCNQGSLVNIEKIESIINQEILLENKIKIYASRRCLPELKKIFFERLKRI